PREIEAHYLETRESERLSEAHGEPERLRTLEILARVLPPAPAVLFDVGGAAGAYAFPLSEQGYVVHLIDPVEIHLEQAKARSTSSGRGVKNRLDGHKFAKLPHKTTVFVRTAWRSSPHCFSCLRALPICWPRSL